MSNDSTRFHKFLIAAGPIPTVSGLFLLIALVVVVIRRSDSPGYALVATVADLEPVHAGVQTASGAVRSLQRLPAGSAVTTDADGRARLRLDDGTACVIDRATKLKVSQKGIELEEGRVFVQGAPTARAEITLGDLTTIVSGSTAAFERHAGAAKAYSVDGEITARAAGGEKRVSAGETVSVADGKLEVVPERAFDDWTGGLAAPWGAAGPPRRAIGELWARPADILMGDPGSPLTVRAHAVEASVDREVARTSSETTYFNGGSNPVSGDFRMALPRGAFVSRFALRRGGELTEGNIALASRTDEGVRPSATVLEWAGEGWLRGHVPGISAGETVGVVIEYVEWLSPRPRAGGSSAVQYRYPLVGDGAPPLIGEFSARVNAGASSPQSIAAGLGAIVTGSAVEVRRSDFRPAADLVVDVEMRHGPGKARLYSADGDPEDEAGGTVVLRTELPAPAAGDGVTLALVLDTSGSAEPSLLDAGRAFIESVLGALGARDRVVVLAADQTVRALGPAAIGPLDAVRRDAIKKALAGVAPGGATDLGRALEAGADALPADAPEALVIYVGDGWPTVGDSKVDEIQSRLARRQGGAPRLGAVAVGPLANRALLAALTRGSGPLFEVSDTTDAARAAVELVADALVPAVAGVEVDFGPLVDRVYPRSPRTVVAGETFTAVGRVREGLPSLVTLRWRDAKGVHEEKRFVEVIRAASDNDVRRAWAAARVEEIVLGGKGREAATDVALRAGLLTPWTAFRLGPVSDKSEYQASALPTRILDLSSQGASVIGPVLATPSSMQGTLAGGRDEGSESLSEDAFKTALVAAAERVIEEAGPAIRACRDSRAALRPELAGALQAVVEIDGEGRAKSARVRGTTPASEDPALDRCVEVVLAGLTYPASGVQGGVKVDHLIYLPPSNTTLGARKCSATSRLPMPLRRGIWRERLEQGKAWDVYLEAKRQCELPTWTDRRALLELVLLRYEAGLERLDVATNLIRYGETDAAELLRRETVRRARTPEELAAVRQKLVGEERFPAGLLEKRYKEARDDRGRLAVIRRFLSVAPHDSRLRQKLVLLLEALGDKPQLVEEVRTIRLDPFADAELLADCAAALRRVGVESEARRAFGELVERAPRDPWVRAFLGDRLRIEGWYDDAVSTYAVLEDLVPDDPAGVLRLALAHAGAGRLDISERMLTRVAQTGGRAGEAKLGRLASRLASTLAAEARARPNLSKDEAERLLRMSLEIPRDGNTAVLLVRGPAASAPLSVKLVRGPADAREEREPDVRAESLGLYSMSFDDEASKLVVARRAELPPARPTRVRVDALLPDGAERPPRLVSANIDLPSDGKPVELAWADGGWRRGEAAPVDAAR